MTILSQKRQTRESLNQTITTLADQLHETQSERDTLREVLSASLDATRCLQQRLDLTQDSRRRLLETIRSARKEQARLAA